MAKTTLKYFLTTVAIFSATVFVSIAQDTPDNLKKNRKNKHTESTLPNQHAPSQNRGVQSNATSALYFDGIKSFITGDLYQAKLKLQEYSTQFPNEAAPYFYLSSIYAEEGLVGKSKTSIQKAMSLEPNNFWYKERFANILAYDKDYLGAAKLYQDLAREAGYPEEYYLRAAMLYAASDKTKDAVAMLDKMQEKSYDEEIEMQKAEIYASKKMYDDAIAVLNKMLASNKYDSKVHGMLMDIYLEKKDKSAALKVLNNAKHLMPDDVSIQLAEARYHHHGGDTAKFDQAIKNTITNNKLDAGTQLSLLVPYLQSIGKDSVKLKEGLKLADQVSQQHPDNAEVQAVYGDLLYYSQKQTEAANQYKKAIAIDPSKQEVWQQLLFAYTDKKNADSLLKYVDEALLYFPNAPMFYYVAGLGNFYKEQYNASATQINKALDLLLDEKDPLREDLLSMLGDVYHADKKYELSDSVYSAVLKLNPDNASVLNNYAYYLSTRKLRLDEAEKMSKRSLELKPKEATFLDTYGWVMFQQGKYDKAKTYIEQALDQKGNENDGAVLEHLGDVHFKLGNKKKALEYWQKAKEKDVDNLELLEKKIKDQNYYE